mgnify:CR=1 FL=1
MCIRDSKNAGFYSARWGAINNNGQPVSAGVYFYKIQAGNFVDTKKILGTWIQYAKYIKINDYEYQNSKPFLVPEISNKIIHTMGADGCEYKGKRYPVNKVDVKDVSGAGDSFMSGLVVEYCKTDDIVKSIKFANKCASSVVKQRGVTLL